MTDDDVQEMKEQLRALEQDFDVLSRFLMAYCALPKGTVPDIGLTPTAVYLTLTTQGTGPIREKLEKFIDFGKLFI